MNDLVKYGCHISYIMLNICIPILPDISEPYIYLNFLLYFLSLLRVLSVSGQTDRFPTCQVEYISLLETSREPVIVTMSGYHGY